MAINVDKYSQLPTYDTFNLFGNNKVPFIILLIFVILIYIILFSFLNNNPTSSPSSLWIIILEVILVITLIIIIALNYDSFHEINFSTELKNLFGGGTPQVDIVAHDINDNENEHEHEHKLEKEPSKECPATDISGEVFHIPNNTYTYDEAKNMCQSLDTRLATYDEIESAYNNGGNWCSYGWSDEQMALFPTQKSVYNQLKTIKGHENDCGRPGINGGYIGNKNAKFGINCYGKKPYITDKDKYFMDNYTFSPAIPDSSYNKITKDKTIQNILISSFNKSKWSYQ